MSEVVNPKVFENYRHHDAQSKYPYDLWTDGRAHKLTKGIDWSDKVSANNARISIAKGFRNRGFKLRSMVIDERTIVIQALR